MYAQIKKIKSSERNKQALQQFFIRIGVDPYFSYYYDLCSNINDIICSKDILPNELNHIYNNISSNIHPSILAAIQDEIFIRNTRGALNSTNPLTGDEIATSPILATYTQDLPKTDPSYSTILVLIKIGIIAVLLNDSDDTESNKLIVNYHLELLKSYKRRNFANQVLPKIKTILDNHRDLHSIKNQLTKTNKSLTNKTFLRTIIKLINFLFEKLSLKNRNNTSDISIDATSLVKPIFSDKPNVLEAINVQQTIRLNDYNRWYMSPGKGIRYAYMAYNPLDVKIIISALNETAHFHDSTTLELITVLAICLSIQADINICDFSDLSINKDIFPDSHIIRKVNENSDSTIINCDNKFKIKQSFIHLPLSPLTRLLLSRLRIDENSTGTLQRILNINNDGINEHVKAKLNHLVYKYNLSSASINRLQNTFKNIIFNSCFDQINTFFLCSTPKTIPPSGSHYKASHTQKLECKYRKAFNINSNSDINLENIGYISTKEQLRDDILKNSINNYADSVHLSMTNDKLSISEKHNAFCLYTLSLLQPASTHRPVRDPFSCASHIYFDDVNSSGYCLISDKVSSAAHKWRLAILSPFACKQLIEYQKHIDRLINILSRKPETRNIARAISNNLATNRKPSQINVPYFFLLSKNLKTTESITLTILKENIKKHLPLPANYFRDLFASNLPEQLHPELASTQLGHHTINAQQYDGNSLYSPHLASTYLALPIDNLLRQQGWKIVPGIRKSPARLNLSKIKIEKIHTTKKLGHHAREVAREKMTIIDIEVINNAISEFTTSQILAEPQNTIQLIKADIIIKSKNHSERLHKRFVILQETLTELFKSHTGVRISQTHKLPRFPKSPFSELTLFDFRTCVDFQSKFIAYLDDCGKQHQPYSAEHSIAELVISASIFDCIANTEFTESIAQLMFDVRHDGVYHIFIRSNTTNTLLWHWLPGIISSCLINTFHKNKNDNSNISFSGVYTQLHTIIKTIHPSFKNNQNPFRFLSKLSRSYITITQCGHIRAALTSSSTSPLRCESFLRSCNYTNVSNVLDNDSDVRVEHSNNTWRATAQDCINKKPHRNSKQFKKKIYTLINNSLSVKRSRGENSSTAFRRALSKNIKSEFFDKDLNHIQAAVATWIHHICNAGVIETKQPALSTVRSYISSVVTRMLTHVQDKPFLEMNEDALTDLYNNILNDAEVSSLNQLRAHLSHFHAVTQFHWKIESPEWLLINGRGKYKLVSSNLITYGEYTSILSELFNNKSLTIRERYQYCLILIIMYRFGTRIDEAIGLRVSDIQYSDGFDDVIIHIRKNKNRDNLKTLNARRQAPLAEILSELEISILDYTMHNPFYSSNRQRDRALFTTSVISTDLIAQNTVRDSLQSTMRSVTSDSNLTTHHLRHSYANRMYIYICGQEIFNSPFGKYLNNIIDPNTPHYLPRERFHLHKSLGPYDLYALSAAMGQATPKITVFSYIHVISIYHAFQSTLIFTNKLSDHVYSHLSGISSSSIRKRRSHNKITGANKSNIDLLKHKISSEILVKDKPTNIISNSIPILKKQTVFSLSEISIILFNHGGVDLSKLSTIYSIPITILNNIFDEAQTLEQASRIFDFKLHNQTINYDIKDYSLSKGQHHAINLIHKWSLLIKDYSEQDLRSLYSGTHIWTISKKSKAGKLYFSSRKLLTKFIQFLRKLNIGTHHFDLFISNEPESITRLYKFNSINELKSPENNQHTECALYLARGNKLIPYQYLLNRALFILSLFLIMNVNHHFNIEGES